MSRRSEHEDQMAVKVAEYIDIPSGGKGLDIGCGNGALTIACALGNPRAKILGIDDWSGLFSSGKRDCEKNAEKAKVTNVSFEKGELTTLDFEDETFDAVFSNYGFNSLPGNKQVLMREALRVLKKGGVFAFHDMMPSAKFGNMRLFVSQLRKEGFEDARVMRTDEDLFMSPSEAKKMKLRFSTLVIGKK